MSFASEHQLDSQFWNSIPRVGDVSAPVRTHVKPAAVPSEVLVLLNES